MTWLKLDDTLYMHPKAVAAGYEAMGFWVLALSYCGAHLTDGHVSASVAERIGGRRHKAMATALVRSGLWEVHPLDGWLFHDYLEYSPSRVNVLEERERRRSSGRSNAAKRWGNADRSTDANYHGNPVVIPHRKIPNFSDAPGPVPVKEQKAGQRGFLQDPPRAREAREQKEQLTEPGSGVRIRAESPGVTSTVLPETREPRNGASQDPPGMRRLFGHPVRRDPR